MWHVKMESMKIHCTFEVNWGFVLIYFPLKCIKRIFYSILCHENYPCKWNLAASFGYIFLFRRVKQLFNFQNAFLDGYSSPSQCQMNPNSTHGNTCILHSNEANTGAWSTSNDFVWLRINSKASAAKRRNLFRYVPHFNVIALKRTDLTVVVVYSVDTETSSQNYYSWSTFEMKAQLNMNFATAQGRMNVRCVSQYMLYFHFILCDFATHTERIRLNVDMRRVNSATPKSNDAEESILRSMEIAMRRQLILRMNCLRRLENFPRNCITVIIIAF